MQKIFRTPLEAFAFGTRCFRNQSPLVYPRSMPAAPCHVPPL